MAAVAAAKTAPQGKQERDQRQGRDISPAAEGSAENQGESNTHDATLSTAHATAAVFTRASSQRPQQAGNPADGIDPATENPKLLLLQGLSSTNAVPGKSVFDAAGPTAPCSSPSQTTSTEVIPQFVPREPRTGESSSSWSADERPHRNEMTRSPLEGVTGKAEVTEKDDGGSRAVQVDTSDSSSSSSSSISSSNDDSNTKSVSDQHVTPTTFSSVTFPTVDEQMNTGKSPPQQQQQYPLPLIVPQDRSSTAMSVSSSIRSLDVSTDQWSEAFDADSDSVSRPSCSCSCNVVGTINFFILRREIYPHARLPLCRALYLVQG